MALKINHTTTAGNFPEAYLRIARIELNRPLDGEETYTAYWQMWSTKEFRDSGGSCIDNSATVVTSSDVAQAYIDVKSGFKEAIDC